MPEALPVTCPLDKLQLEAMTHRGGATWAPLWQRGHRDMQPPEAERVQLVPSDGMGTCPQGVSGTNTCWLLAAPLQHLAQAGCPAGP